MQVVLNRTLLAVYFKYFFLPNHITNTILFIDRFREVKTSNPADVNDWLELEGNPFRDGNMMIW